jgi:iron only hydrogenase large subunit-like protein
MVDPIINIDREKCKICYACVRACPVQAIGVKANQEYPHIIHNRCIGCGSCYLACSPKAIFFRDSKEETKAILSSGEKVAAIVSPSISSEFGDITDYRKFVKMLQSLGFHYVHDVAFGVDLAAQKFSELLNDFKGKYYLTTNCPAVVSCIEKFYPQLINNLSPIVSPMIAAAKAVRKLYDNNIKVVFIGPCIAAKDEALRYEEDGKVDSVLTFIELRELFEEFNIKESTLEFSDFDQPLGYKGMLYPISNGFLQCVDIDEKLLSSNIITVEGKNDMLEAVKEFDTNLEFIREHFNIYYCEGCLMGPGMSKNGKKFVRKRLVTDYANKRLKNFDKESWNHYMTDNLSNDYTCSFSEDDQRLPFPPEEKIKEVLAILGRVENTDSSGCGACGYASCRDFAIAVAQGIAKTDMCITYSLKSKHEYIKTLKVTNEKLAKTQEALRQSESIARSEQQATQEALEQTSAMLEKLPSAVVLVDDKLRIIESNESFITILGNEAREINEIIPGLKGADLKTLLPFQFYKLFSYVIDNDENVTNRDVHLDNKLLNVSVFTLKKNKIVGAIIRDMYLPEVRKEEVINRVSEVIDQNLELVQKIAFLLGEGASKTEKMLNSIIESHKASEKG